MKYLKSSMLVITTVFFYLTSHSQIVNKEKKTDSIEVHIESCFCFLDSSSGVKKANCYFSIFNHGNTSIVFPQKLKLLSFGSIGLGLEVSYEVMYQTEDSIIDVSKMYLIIGHPSDKIDSRTVEIKPWEEYYVRVPLDNMYFPNNGFYKIRFSLEPENGNYGTKGLKKKVFSKWIDFQWSSLKSKM